MFAQNGAGPSAIFTTDSVFCGAGAGAAAAGCVAASGFAARGFADETTTGRTGATGADATGGVFAAVVSGAATIAAETTGAGGSGSEGGGALTTTLVDAAAGCASFVFMRAMPAPRIAIVQTAIAAIAVMRPTERRGTPAGGDDSSNELPVDSSFGADDASIAAIVGAPESIAPAGPALGAIELALRGGGGNVMASGTADA